MSAFGINADIRLDLTNATLDASTISAAAVWIIISA
jgi:hypothetical protein